MKMEKFNAPDLLSYYYKEVESNNIQFIDSNQKEKVLSQISKLKQEVEKDANTNWAVAHNAGKVLWRTLVSQALRKIDPASNGSAQLFKYLNSATNFEDALYGLDIYYRDHTLHSLWVYLLGDKLLKGQLSEMYNGLDWYLYNTTENLTNQESVKENIDELLSGAEKLKDSCWAIIALCHDLGYPLSKLTDINKKVENVLTFFDLHGFDRVGYSLRIEHQYIITQFLELMADDMYLVPDNKEEEPLFKLFRDDEVYWSLADSLERREHGILSSFILYKLLNTFGAATVRGPAETWGLESGEALETLTRGLILFAISQHEFAFPATLQFGSLADLLLLVDEVEEFSRWGRPIRSRPYLPTIAEVSLGFDIKQSGISDEKEVTINIHYEIKKEYEEQETLANFFNRKADKLRKKFLIDIDDDRKLFRVAKPLRIKNVNMTVKTDDEKRIFEMNKDSFIAKLPDSETNILKKYNLSLDYNEKKKDEVLIVPNKDDFVPLEDW